MAVCITLKLNIDSSQHCAINIVKWGYFQIKHTELHIVIDITNIFPAVSVQGTRLLWRSIFNSLLLFIENTYHREQYLKDKISLKNNKISSIYLPGDYRVVYKTIALDEIKIIKTSLKIVAIMLRKLCFYLARIVCIRVEFFAVKSSKILNNQLYYILNINYTFQYIKASPKFILLLIEIFKEINLDNYNCELEF